MLLSFPAHSLSLRWCLWLAESDGIFVSRQAPLFLVKRGMVGVMGLLRLVASLSPFRMSFWDTAMDAMAGAPP